MNKIAKNLSILLAMSWFLLIFASHAGAAADDGAFVIQPKFDDVGMFFGDGKDEAAFVKLNEKWGLIDKTGRFLVQPKYDDYRLASATTAFVQIDEKWGLIGADGKEIVTPKYDMVGIGFSDGLAAVFANDKWGYIDEKGHEVIPPRFMKASAFEGGIAYVEEYNADTGITHSYIIDTSGSRVAELPDNLSYPWDVVGGKIFDEGLLWVSLSVGEYDMKMGVFDPKTGKIVIEPKIDNPVFDGSGSQDFNEGHAFAAINGKLSIVNRKGEIVSDLPQYHNAEYIYEQGFNEGYAAISIGGIDGKYGYIDSTGKEIVAHKYDYAANFSNGLARVERNNKWGFIDKSGKEVIPLEYDLVGDFSPEGLAYVEKNGKYGFIDKSGKIVTAIQYDFASNYYDGYSAVKKGEKWGLIDKTGKEIVKPQYDALYVFGSPDDFDAHGVTDFAKTFFSGGFLAANINGKWGYIAKPEPPVPAVPTASKVLINGKEVSFESYNIDGYNYFKLRDLAAALNGSEKSFEIRWDAAKNAIILESRKAYTPIGGELQTSGRSAQQSATVTDTKIYLDGKEVRLKAYNIGGFNYFRLRDIGKLLDFGVTWNEQVNAIEIDTSASYREE